MKKILNDRVVTLPGVFLRMVKVNNMEKYDYDKINSMHHPVKAAPNPMGGPGFGAIMGNGMQGFTMPGASGASQGKLNRMGQYSVNQLSSKHMAYNQLMVASGKGALFMQLARHVVLAQASAQSKPRPTRAAPAHPPSPS